MENWAHEGELIRELTLRVAALEDNVAFLEVWCEEQQDTLDRVGEPYWFLEDDHPEPVRLYVVDLRDDPDVDESDHERRVRQIRARLDNLRHGLARGAPG
jgi:hypothetical protein